MRNQCFETVPFFTHTGRRKLKKTMFSFPKPAGALQLIPVRVTFTAKIVLLQTCGGALTHDCLGLAFPGLAWREVMPFLMQRSGEKSAQQHVNRS